jgi:hypothetical protein
LLDLKFGIVFVGGACVKAGKCFLMQWSSDCTETRAFVRLGFLFRFLDCQALFVSLQFSCGSPNRNGTLNVTHTPAILQSSLSFEIGQVGVVVTLNNL